MSSGWLMIPCRHAHELISARLDGTLTRRQRFKLWLHLRACAMCTRVAKQADFMRQAMRRLGS